MLRRKGTVNTKYVFCLLNYIELCSTQSDKHHVKENVKKGMHCLSSL